MTNRGHLVLRERAVLKIDGPLKSHYLTADFFVVENRIVWYSGVLGQTHP